MALDDARPGITDVIDRIGLGFFHLRTLIIGGGIWLADGAELLLISSASRAVSEEWNMQPWQVGSVVSVVFVGIFLGNSLSGPFADANGRRLAIYISYFAIAIFSVLSACSVNFWTLCFVRLLVGASFGFGQPSWNTMASEMTPTKWRVVMAGGSQLLFIFGELFSAVLVWCDDPTMEHLNWRRLFVLGAIPSIILAGLSLALLPQSPMYLALRGQHDEAIKVLEQMRDVNGAAGSVDYKPTSVIAKVSAREAVSAPMRTVFGPQLRYTTLTTVYSCFVLNTVFYGCLYAFPQVVTEVDFGFAPAVNLMIGALWEFPGYTFGIFLGMTFPRKTVILWYLMAITASLVLFTFAALTVQAHGSMVWLLHAGFFGIKAFVGIGFVSVYMYSVEVYPTVCRSTGTAICLAGGRFGGILAPLVYERLYAVTGGFGIFFYLIAILACLNAVMVFFLPFETFGQPLRDSLDELQPLCSKEP